MESPDEKNKSLWESQNARLGSFLIASSFLVAGFIQLIVADKEIDIIVHAIAALGGFLATLYFFMNLWLIMPSWIPKCIRGDESTTPTQPQLMHSWIIPLAFVAFWSVAWCNYTNLCWTIPFYSFLGFILAFYIFQRFLRKWLKL